MSQQVTLEQLYNAKKSVSGRLSKLRTSSSIRHWRETNSERDSPIQAIGVFAEEIECMERTLRSMRDRLNNAKITVEI